MSVEPNPASRCLSESKRPVLMEGAWVHPQAFVSGDVTLGREVFVAPFASIRADEGSPFCIGDGSNIQDGVVLHALETFREDGQPIPSRLVEKDGQRYAIYIGQDVSVAHQAQIHGPSAVMDHTFVGMQAFVFKSQIGQGCVIEPGAKVMGVRVPDGRIVPMGTVVRDQAQADQLPVVNESYPLARLNEEVVRVNRSLARGYSSQAS